MCGSYNVFKTLVVKTHMITPPRKQYNQKKQEDIQKLFYFSGKMSFRNTILYLPVRNHISPLVVIHIKWSLITENTKVSLLMLC